MSETAETESGDEVVHTADADEDSGESVPATGTDGSGGGTRIDPDRATRYLQYAGVVVLLVTALVALVGFYTGVGRVIQVWVAEQYRPVFNAAFNLALLLGALAGIGLLLRRLD